jgi:hypothetical protein
MGIKQKRIMKKNGLLLVAALLLLGSCETARTKRPQVYGGGGESEGLYEKGGSDVLPFLIDGTSRDQTYGFTSDNPVRVGGGRAAGARSQQRYLNALRGPEGQEVEYEREGSCCAFKTRRGTVDNDGQLDIYTVTWKGRKEPMKLYLNMYARAELKAPVGFTAAR